MGLEARGDVTTSVDPRLARARPDARRFAPLLLELLLLLAVLKLFRFEDALVVMTATACGGFAIHYWLPLRWKEWAWIAISIVGACLIVAPLAAALLLAAALAFFAIGRAPWPYAVRVLATLALGVACTLGRAYGAPHVPEQLWAVLGSVFGFRLIVWLYDLKHARAPPSLREFLAYFLLLPNWACLLFPVVDFHTQRRGFYARDGHEIAQTGVRWMARGLLQLLLYRWIYYNKPVADPASVRSLAQLALVMVTTYLLYLRLSGLFHFVIGVVHLFGYDLPETNRRYLLASSLTDFWRRINIYWKDFMVKVVYFPAFFRLRRGGERRAQIAATALVFVVTWFLHALQGFWLTGSLRFSGPDAAFWGILGLLVVVNVALESAKPRRSRAPPTRTTPAAMLVRGLKIVGTFALITVLWSMWNAPSFSRWFDLLTWWRTG